MTALPRSRGEVWWCELAEIGRRPVVVLSRDAVIPRHRRALVAPCSTTIGGLVGEVVLEPGEDPVARRSAVNLDSVESVSIAGRMRNGMPVRPSQPHAAVTERAKAAPGSGSLWSASAHARRLPVEPGKASSSPGSSRDDVERALGNRLASRATRYHRRHAGLRHRANWVRAADFSTLRRNT